MPSVHESDVRTDQQIRPDEIVGCRADAVVGDVGVVPLLTCPLRTEPRRTRVLKGSSLIRVLAVQVDRSQEVERLLCARLLDVRGDVVQ